MKEHVRKLGQRASAKAKQDRADEYACRLFGTVLHRMSGDLSLNEIARRLNKRKIPSASGKTGAWTARAVQNIYNRVERMNNEMFPADRPLSDSARELWRRLNNPTPEEIRADLEAYDEEMDDWHQAMKRGMMMPKPAPPVFCEQALDDDDEGTEADRAKRQEERQRQRAYAESVLADLERKRAKEWAALSPEEQRSCLEEQDAKENEMRLLKGFGPLTYEEFRRKEELFKILGENLMNTSPEIHALREEWRRLERRRESPEEHERRIKIARRNQIAFLARSVYPLTMEERLARVNRALERSWRKMGFPFGRTVSIEELEAVLAEEGAKERELEKGLD